MSPLQLSILLHYYSMADDFRGGDFSAPAVREAIEHFKREKMLEHTQGDATGTYQATERTHVYIRALLNMPLPESRWVMP